MRNFHMLSALAAALIAGSAAPAKEKTEQPKEKKICRTVEVSGRVTPQKICRKVVQPSAEQESQRSARGDESDKSDD